MRVTIPAAVAVLCAVVLSGCSASYPDKPVAPKSTSSSTTAEPSTASPEAPVQADIVFDQLDSITGARRRGFDTMAIDVPSSMEPSMRESEDGLATQARLVGADSSVIFMMKDAANASVEAIKSEADSMVSKLISSGVTSSVIQSETEWDGIPYVVILSFDLTDKSAGEQESIMIIMGNPDGSQIVTAQATAAQGLLETSEAYAALRTLRFDGV